MKKKYQEKEELLRAYNRLSMVTKKEFKQLILLSRDRSPVIRFEVASVAAQEKISNSKGQSVSAVKKTGMSNASRWIRIIWLQINRSEGHLSVSGHLWTIE